MSQGQAHPCGVRSRCGTEHLWNRSPSTASPEMLLGMLCFVRSWQKLGSLVLFGSVRGRGAGLVPAVRDGRRGEEEVEDSRIN